MKMKQVVGRCCCWRNLKGHTLFKGFFSLQKMKNKLECCLDQSWLKNIASISNSHHTPPINWMCYPSPCFLSICASSVSYRILIWVCRLYAYIPKWLTIPHNNCKMTLHRNISRLFWCSWWPTWGKMTRKLEKWLPSLHYDISTNIPYIF